MNDPQIWTMVWGLTVGTGEGLVEEGKGEKWDNCNVITIKKFLQRKIYRESTRERVKPRIKSTIWNIRNQKTPNKKARRKKELKKNEDSVRSLWNISSTPTFISQGCQGEERERKTGSLFEIRHTSPGSAVSQTR